MSDKLFPGLDLDEKPRLSGDTLDAARARTPKGMAHWSGVGNPPGTICKTCHEIRLTDKPNMGWCHRFWRAYPKMKQKNAPRFNVNTAACKWWSGV